MCGSENHLEYQWEVLYITVWCPVFWIICGCFTTCNESSIQQCMCAPMCSCDYKHKVMLRYLVTYTYNIQAKQSNWCLRCISGYLCVQQHWFIVQLHQEEHSIRARYIHLEEREAHISKFVFCALSIWMQINYIQLLWLKWICVHKYLWYIRAFKQSAKVVSSYMSA